MPVQPAEAAAADSPTVAELPTAATPSGLMTALGPGILSDLLDPLSGGRTPGSPAAAPFAWAALAVTRRQSGAAAVTSAATAAASSNSITVDPTVQWNGGDLYGTLNASSQRGLELTYTVIDKPSLGGKISWAPETDGVRPDLFSYLPYMTTLSDPTQNEKFSVMVAEVTAFDKLMKQIPIVKDFWDPLVKTLHRLPVIGTLLSPIIGHAVITEFDENPSTLAAGRPVAFTYMMPSFDRISISVNYFPATNVANGTVDSAPTVLNGPDLGFPGNTDVFSNWAPSLVNIVPGLVALRGDASPLAGGYSGGGGYNVITWDPRGEWASGGKMQLDNPNFEGRDVSTIISWATSSADVAQSQVATDASGDPYIGMVGGSYGGGIQLVVAGTPDKRVDAIVPAIAWNTLTQSLYPNADFKTVIGSELLSALGATGARINSQIYAGIASGVFLGLLSDASRALLINSGPGILANNITAPTLFLQGTPDILFELDAAMTNGQMITTANPTVPVKTTWFCGGHGVCLLDSTLQHEQGAMNMDNTLMWLDQYVAQSGTPADSIPKFQWFDQTGQYHSSDLNPFDPAFNAPDKLNYRSDGGSLLLVPLIGGSGPSEAAPPGEKVTAFGKAFALASGSKARNALNLDVAPPVGSVIAGAPTLSFSYRGLGPAHAVFAQLVDNATGLVVGNIVTPVTVFLDGREHTVSIPMADIAYTVSDPSDSLTLQIASSALPYADAWQWGFVNIGDVKLEVPVVASAPTPQPSSL
jgi:ABC-2 type transport system ATP-binding protein